MTFTWLALNTELSSGNTPRFRLAASRPVFDPVRVKRLTEILGEKCQELCACEWLVGFEVRMHLCRHSSQPFIE